VVRPRLTYANVMATAAVFIALGSGSYAAVKVTGRSVKDGSLTGADVKNSSLRSKDIRNRSLRAIDFRRGALRGREGRPGADGFDGFDGFDGADGAPGPGITLASGRVNGVASGTAPATFFGSPSGAGPSNGSEAPVQVLSPADDAVATDLSVVLTRFPCDDGIGANSCGDPGSATITLRVDGADTQLACTITTPDTACDSAASADVHAGARLSLKIAGGLDGSAALNRDMLFGLALRPPD
jgi:hypothetical protein